MLMIGRRAPRQEVLFVAGSMRSFIPDDHILVQVDRVLELSWLEDEVREVYCEETGRPSIAPEAAVRLMVAGFLLGIVHDRALLREAQVNLAIRWFVGYGLDEALPDHSSPRHVASAERQSRLRSLTRKGFDLKASVGTMIRCLFLVPSSILISMGYFHFARLPDSICSATVHQKSLKEFMRRLSRRAS